MPDPAPTLAAILLAKDYKLTVHCESCRVVRQFVDVEGLALKYDEHRPISEFRFRCQRCGEIGQPQVTGPGNSSIGYPIIWPSDELAQNA